MEEEKLFARLHPHLFLMMLTFLAKKNKSGPSEDGVQCCVCPAGDSSSMFKMQNIYTQTMSTQKCTKKENQPHNSLTFPVLVHLHSCTNRTDQLFFWGVIPPQEQTLSLWHCFSQLVSLCRPVLLCQNKRHLHKTNHQQIYTFHPLHSKKGTFRSQLCTIPIMSSEM